MEVVVSSGCVGCSLSTSQPGQGMTSHGNVGEGRRKKDRSKKKKRKEEQRQDLIFVDFIMLFT